MTPSKDPFASEQLLRAARQLQEAIKSARQRRHSHTNAASSFSSLRSSQCNNSSDRKRDATFDDAFQRPGGDEASDSDYRTDSVHSDKENLRHDHNSNARVDEDGSTKRLSERFPTQAASSIELLGPPYLSDGEDDGSVFSDWERGGNLHLSELSLSAMIQPENAGAEPSPTRSEATRANLVDSIQDVTRKALDWMQRDGEQQAKENKAMQELLYGVILVVNDVVRDLVSADAAIYCHHIAEVNQWRELSMDKVEDLVSEWEDVLAEWKQVALEEKQELKESVGLFQEEYDARLQSLMRSHVLERDELKEQIVHLVSLCNRQQMMCEDYASSKVHTAILSSTVATNTDEPDEERSKRGLAEREIVDLQAQLKEAELCSLHWQMAYEDQLACLRQSDERLGMLLEESASVHDELVVQRRNLSRTIPIDTLRIYQQKIAFLEDQVDDTKQQIACDREQFLYEQAKWGYEKKQLGKDVEEIQDVSVKVLKLLLIREKMLKKQERANEKRGLRWDGQCKALKAIAQDLMQECALILVVLQEHATAASSSRPIGAGMPRSFPVKPVQIKKMLKRLKKIDHAILEGTHPKAPSLASTVSDSVNGSFDASLLDSHKPSA